MKWLAIGIGALSLPVALLLSLYWSLQPGSAAHAAVGWLLGAILAAQLTALILRQWRLALIAPLLSCVLLAIDAEWLGPCREGCTVTLQVPAPSR